MSFPYLKMEFIPVTTKMNFQHLQCHIILQRSL